MQFTFYYWPFGLFVTFPVINSSGLVIIVDMSWFESLTTFLGIFLMWVKLLSQTMYILKAGVFWVTWLFQHCGPIPWALFLFTRNINRNKTGERKQSSGVHERRQFWLSSEEYCLLHASQITAHFARFSLLGKHYSDTGLVLTI